MLKLRTPWNEILKKMKMKFTYLTFPSLKQWSEFMIIFLALLNPTMI